MSTGFCWMATLLLLCSAAHSRVPCPELWRLDNPNTNYVLVFLTPPDTTGDDKQREEERQSLMAQGNAHLSDIPRDLSKRSGSKKGRNVQLVACEHRISISDLNRKEIEELMQAGVVHVLWKAPEGAAFGLVQLAVPVYMRKSSATRQNAEVVTPFPGKADNPFDDWMEIFAEVKGAPYQPFVELGLADAYQSGKELGQAWSALCGSRLGLASLALSALRPKREVLETEITAHVVELMQDLEQAARKTGIWPLPPCPTAAPPAPQ